MPVRSSTCTWFTPGRLISPGSSAVVVVIDDKYLDRVENALTKSTKKVSKALEAGDYDKITKAINDAGDNIADALES